jgi:chromosome segregation protein
MYLKSLQLIGFKSFAEKTTLDFLPGVTAVVGPNGCGKSNISDAIRWVLGEQSAKALRGSEMADVIFNGTDGRKAINLAEVSMTFAEVDAKTLSLPGVNLDFTEITITRRVHRDGTGEYFINKTPCRLRDIQGLFMDTGIGRSSYSLMAQGQIDQILSAHPEDRRTIFEEAAGINKYKHQKKEALRKLEYTEANLVRITDIIKEVKRQIISLQRQAGKARRYKELFDQLKALDTRLARHKYDLLHSEISGLESEITNFVHQSDAFDAQIAEKEQQIADLRRSLSEIERAINDAVAKDHELKSESDRHEQRMTTDAERITELEQLIENHHRETAGAEEKIRVQEELLASLNAEFEQIDSLLATEQAKLQAQQEAGTATRCRVVAEEHRVERSQIGAHRLGKHDCSWPQRTCRPRPEEEIRCRPRRAALDRTIATPGAAPRARPAIGDVQRRPGGTPQQRQHASCTLDRQAIRIAEHIVRRSLRRHNSITSSASDVIQQARAPRSAATILRDTRWPLDPRADSRSRIAIRRRHRSRPQPRDPHDFG